MSAESRPSVRFMPLPNPVVVRERTPSREEFVEYLLACLILGDEPPGQNRPSRPSERGAHLLANLARCSFDQNWPGDPEFSWEFRLPAIDGYKEGWVDLAVRYPDALYLIELKTERGALQVGQTERYLQLGRHHYPALSVVILFVTPEPVEPGLYHGEASDDFANMTWLEVGAEVDLVWADCPDRAERAFAETLTGYLTAAVAEWGMPRAGRSVPRTAPAPKFSASLPSQPFTPDPNQGPPSLDEALLLAEQVQATTKTLKLAYEYGWSSENHARAFREAVNAELGAADLPNVEVWLWRGKETTMGDEWTPTGGRCGFEVRLSHHKRPLR